MIQAAGLIGLWAQGFVEPVIPPARPLHIFAQQIMALALQTGGLPRDHWPQWIGQMPGFAAIPTDLLESVVDHMIASDVLSNDNGLAPAVLPQSAAL